MVLRNYPLSLKYLALQALSQCLLEIWEAHLKTNNFCMDVTLNDIGLIPYTIIDKIFKMIVHLHSRAVRAKNSDLSTPSLIKCIVNSNQRKLSLYYLQYIGMVLDIDILCLESVIINKLPNLKNLEEINLRASGTDCTLPTCNDKILDEIGKWCPKLKSLDISFNYAVTDNGLKYLLPRKSRKGCTSLVKLSLFECSISAEGIAYLLMRLPLQFVGYKETGQCILHLRRINSFVPVKKLNLLTVDNVGVDSQTCNTISQLRCTVDLVNALNQFCPKLNSLKVRINDEDIYLLINIKSLTTLELLYDTGYPSSPSSGTIQYLNFCGSQLASVGFQCNSYSTKYLKVVCEQCSNLKKLLICCNNFQLDQDITNSDRRNCILNYLEYFSFNVGWPGLNESRIPHCLITYVLHKTSVLKELVLAMNNSLFCDSFIETLFSSIPTDNLNDVMIHLPLKDATMYRLNLTFSSVRTLRVKCPRLRLVGALCVWNISYREYSELKKYLTVTNISLKVIY